MTDKIDWQDLKTIAKVERISIQKGVENNLHWTLDDDNNMEKLIRGVT